MQHLPLTLAGALGAAVAVLLWQQARASRVGVWVWKPAASALFVALAIAVGAAGADYGRLVLVALALSWIGDVLLIPRDRRAFLGGIGAFLLAHVAYAAAFVGLGVSWTWALATAAPLAVVAIGVGAWLLPRVPPRLLAPVVAYMVVISAMVALGVGAVAAGATGWVLVAALAFYVSDLTVARDRFVTRGFSNKLVGWPLYYGAQAAFALTVALA